MSQTWRTFRQAVIVGAAWGAVIGAGWLPWSLRSAAQDPDQVEAPEQIEAPSDPAPGEEATAKIDPSVYVVPDDADVATLWEKKRKLDRVRPATAVETNKHERKKKSALKKFAARIVTLEPDRTTPAYRWARAYGLELRLSGLAAATAEERRHFVDQVKAALAENVDEYTNRLAIKTAQSLEHAGLGEEAAKALEEFLPTFAASKSPVAKATAGRIAAVLRRLRLIGSQMELVGKTTDDAQFDIASLKGKVVLVDFWATWCGPCVASMPALKQAYAAYKDKGFEIVGVSHDRDKKSLEEFVQQNSLDWPQVYDPTGGGRPEVSENYGIAAYPTMFLISSEGKVLTATIRADGLMAELEKLLGPPLEAKAEEVKAEEAEKKE